MKILKKFTRRFTIFQFSILFLGVILIIGLFAQSCRAGTIQSEFTIEGRSVTGLVDSGASIVTIPASMAYNLGLDMQIPVSTARFSTANGIVSAPIYEGVISMFGRPGVRLEYSVMDGLETPLIGMNAMKAFGAAIDTLRGVITQGVNGSAAKSRTQWPARSSQAQPQYSGYYPRADYGRASIESEALYAEKCYKGIISCNK